MVLGNTDACDIKAAATDNEERCKHWWIPHRSHGCEYLLWNHLHGLYPALQSSTSASDYTAVIVTCRNTGIPDYHFIGTKHLSIYPVNTLAFV